MKKVFFCGLMGAVLLLGGCGMSDAISKVTGSPSDSEVTKETKAKLLNVEGLQASSRGDYAFAATKFKQAIEVKEESEYYNNLGRCYYWLGRYSDALRSFAMVEKLSKKPNAGLQANIGDVFRQQGDYTEAIKYYHQALNVDPNFARAHYELGNLYLKQGDYKSAEERLNRTLQIDPSFSKAMLARLIVYRLTRKYEKAYSDLRILDRRGYSVQDDLKEDILTGVKQMRQQGKYGGETL